MFAPVLALKAPTAVLGRTIGRSQTLGVKPDNLLESSSGQGLLAFGRRHGTERSRGVSLPETRCCWPMVQNLSSAAPNSVTSSHNDSSLSPKAGRGRPPPIPGSASAIIANISAIALALRSRRAEFIIAVPGSIRFSGSANGSAASRMLGATFRQNFGAISPMDRLL